VNASGTITFQFLNTPFRLAQRDAVRRWIFDCLLLSGHRVGELNFLFTNDEEMLSMNRAHLDHDYYTDILTFPTSSAQGLSADIVISIDRTRENAKTLNSKPLDELHRVIAHGVLHLTGLEDDTEEAKIIMRATEEEWLAQRTFLTT
jgi:probable rRNA maturation factor